MHIKEPDFYNDLDLSLARARTLLERGGKDRRSPMHSPVVATIDADGQPQQRIMILRQVDWSVRQLRFHTDSRTAKVEQLDVNGRVSVLAYDPSAKIQLRLSGGQRVFSTCRSNGKTKLLQKPLPALGPNCSKCKSARQAARDNAVRW
jgi:pyridoxamine 5'-phosphate oxidase